MSRYVSLININPSGFAMPCSLTIGGTLLDYSCIHAKILTDRKHALIVLVVVVKVSQYPKLYLDLKKGNHSHGHAKWFPDHIKQFFFCRSFENADAKSKWWDIEYDNRSIRFVPFVVNGICHIWTREKRGSSIEKETCFFHPQLR